MSATPSPLQAEIDAGQAAVVREIARNCYAVSLPKRERPRLRSTDSGFLVPCAHVISAPYDSPLGQALLQADDASHVRWDGTSKGVVSFKVNSLGLKRVRQIIAENAPIPELKPIAVVVRPIHLASLNGTDVEAAITATNDAYGAHLLAAE